MTEQEIEKKEIASHKVAISGHLFDTAKSKKHYHLMFFDGKNIFSGDAYLAKNNIWYILTPAQWSNYQSWEILGVGKKGAERLLKEYMDFLDEEAREEIAKNFNINFD
jgi:hypothetical protein